MPEVRKDPVLERWVIVSEERSGRPLTIPEPEAVTDPSTCPFCPGNESETLPEIAACRAPGTRPDEPGWRVRVIPNKYPAVRRDAAPIESEDAPFERMAGLGHHEVIIEGEAHTRSLSELPVERLREVVGVYRDRLRALSDDDRIKSALIIKNVGAAAGASIEHSHSQLIATPVLPPAIEDELACTERAAAVLGGCPWCGLIDREQDRGERIVAIGEELVALCPWAARQPYETWILPRGHQSHFETASDATLDALSVLLSRVLRGIETCMSHPPYNLAIHSAPYPIASREHLHWRITILPRVTRIAGYEQATGLYINPVAPERAAAAIRNSLGEG